MEAPSRTVFAFGVDGVAECLPVASLPRSCIFAIQYSVSRLFIFSGHRQRFYRGSDLAHLRSWVTLQCALALGGCVCFASACPASFRPPLCRRISICLIALLSSGNAIGAEIGLRRLVANRLMTLEALVEGFLIPPPWGITPTLGLLASPSPGKTVNAIRRRQKSLNFFKKGGCQNFWFRYYISLPTRRKR